MRDNLACDGCQLGRLEQAFKLGEANQMKLAGLEDPDVEPLWKNIG